MARFARFAWLLTFTVVIRFFHQVWLVLWRFHLILVNSTDDLDSFPSNLTSLAFEPYLGQLRMIWFRFRLL